MTWGKGLGPHNEFFNAIENPWASRHFGPFHTRDWEPVTITRQALSLVEKAEPVQIRFRWSTLEGPTEYICECKIDVKVYMDSYMA